MGGQGVGRARGEKLVPFFSVEKQGRQGQTTRSRLHLSSSSVEAESKPASMGDGGPAGSVYYLLFVRKQARETRANNPKLVVLVDRFSLVGI
jgi:hypothetical protein